MQTLQTQIGTILIASIVSAGGTMLASYLFTSPVNASNSISEIRTKIAVIEKNDSVQDVSIKEMKDNIEYIRRGVEQIAQKQGIIVKQ